MLEEFPSQSIQEDNSNDGSESGGQRLGVPPSGQCNGIRGAVDNKGIHPDTAGKHGGASSLLDNL